MPQKHDPQSGLPLHQQIAQSIQQDILDRNLAPHTRIPSEIDLTNHYGVSHNTINKAIGALVHKGVLYRLRPQGTFVAETPTQETLTPVHHHNPTEGLKEARIGLIVPYLADSFLDNIVQGVVMEAQTAGYRVDLTFSENDWAMERYHIMQFLQQHVAGIVIFPGDHPVEICDGKLASTNGQERIELLRTLQKQHMPFVLLDRYVPEIECNTIVSDDFTAGYEATCHLIKLGHKRIGFIAVTPMMTSSITRLQGYQQALQDHGIAVEETLLLQTLRQRQPSMVPGHPANQGLDPQDLLQVRAYLQQPEPPQAVLALNDYVALQVLQAAQDIERPIPDQLALVCCGGGDIGLFTRVPFTSILQPAMEIGRQGVRTLVDGIAQRSSKIRQITLPVSLMVRKSCGAEQRNLSLLLETRRLQTDAR